MLRSFSFLMLGLLGANLALAQNCLPQRYLQGMFQVDTLTDVVFGNAPAMPFVYVAENVTVPYDLEMDIYLPAGDTLSQRPVVLFGFGGGFLIGSKEDEDVRSLCDSFARKGYVAAAINYRLGLNTVSSGSAERAVWRGVQDWSAAIRYLKEFRDTYHLDTNAFFAGGASAGSFGALMCQYLDDSQRPASTFSAGIPFPQPDLGCKDCSGNTYSHLSSVRGLINCWGAIGDTAWIDAQDSVPMVSFHGDLDAIVPYNYGFPFTALFTAPQVYGSNLISLRQTHVGLQHEMNTFLGEGHNIWGTVVNHQFTPTATAHWIPILDSIRNFLWDILEPHTGPISGAQSVAVNDVRTYSVPAAAGYRWCWNVTGGTIISSGNTGNSIDVRWDQAGVRTVKVRPVSHLDAVGPEEEVLIQVLPTSATEPSGALGNIHTWQNGNTLFLKGQNLAPGKLVVSLHELNGRSLLQAEVRTNGQLDHQFDLGGMPAGLYLLGLKSGMDMETRKIVLR